MAPDSQIRARSVSIVVAAYDQVSTLEQTVSSALDQQGEVDVCVVIVVDACPHGTGTAARAIERRFPDRVEVIELEDNVGQAGARDVGLSVVATPWVLFLDGDDLLKPSALSTLLDAAEADSPAHAVLARYVKFDEAGVREVDRRLGTVGDHQEISAFRARPAPLSVRSFLTDFRVGPPGCWLLDAATARTIGGFDPALRSNEDVEFMVRLLTATTPREIAAVVLEKRMHMAQQTADRGLQMRTHVRALWRTLRRSTVSRPAVVHGIVGCYELRARTVLTYDSRGRRLKAAIWAACAVAARLVIAVESFVRRVVGPLGPPAWPAVPARLGPDDAGTR